jgi:hypothetical protein
MIQFQDLPQVRDHYDLRNAHRAGTSYFINGRAHTEMSCMFVNATALVGNPGWRIATEAERRRL